MPLFVVTITFVDSAGKNRVWTGRRGGSSGATACAAAADQIRSRPSVMVVTGGSAVEVSA